MSPALNAFRTKKSSKISGLVDHYGLHAQTTSNTLSRARPFLLNCTEVTYFIATPPDRGWQRSEGLLLLHSFLSLDILVAFSILRFGTSAKSVS